MSTGAYFVVPSPVIFNASDFVREMIEMANASARANHDHKVGGTTACDLLYPVSSSVTLLAGSSSSSCNWVRS